MMRGHRHNHIEQSDQLASLLNRTELMKSIEPRPPFLWIRRVGKPAREVSRSRRQSHAAEPYNRRSWNDASQNLFRLEAPAVVAEDPLPLAVHLPVATGRKERPG